MLGLGITNLDIFYYNKKPPSPQFNTKYSGSVIKTKILDFYNELI